MNPSDEHSQRLPSPRRSAEIVGALGYLDQSFADQRAFALLISDAPDFAADVTRRFLQAHEQELRCLRLPVSTDSAHTFLQTLLIELGFGGPIESTVDDLQRLLLVVFRQAQAESRRCVVLLEQAQELGPRVFEALRDLARGLMVLRPTPLFILTGTSGLARVIDSRGMASISHLTRLRFEAEPRRQSADDASAAPLQSVGPTPGAAPTECVSLAITLQGRLINRVDIGTERLLIGRGAHNDLNLSGRYVSRHHAMLLPGPAETTLMDLKSTNGTLVNSRAIRSRRLEDGDWISIGNYRLRFTDTRPKVAMPGRADRDPRGLGETIVMRSMRGIGNSSPDTHKAATRKKK